MYKIQIKYSETKYHLGISGKGLITSLGLKTIRSLNTTKKAGFAITEVSLKYIYKIIKEFKDVPYEGYVRKRSKNIPTDNYLYLAINLSVFMRSMGGRGSKDMPTDIYLYLSINLAKCMMVNLRGSV